MSDSLVTVLKHPGHNFDKLVNYSVYGRYGTVIIFSQKLAFIIILAKSPVRFQLC
jgi:hypothetical protein